MPLLSSCLHFCQTCHFYKIVICQDAPFCHLICIWPNSWTLHFCPVFFLFRLNLPFSYYNHHLSRFPSLSLQLRFCQTFNGFLPNSLFLKFAIFAKIANCQYASFVVSFNFFCQTFNESLAKFANFAKNVIFVNPTIIDMPLLSSCSSFCQTF